MSARVYGLCLRLSAGQPERRNQSITAALYLLELELSNSNAATTVWIALRAIERWEPTKMLEGYLAVCLVDDDDDDDDAQQQQQQAVFRYLARISYPAGRVVHQHKHKHKRKTPARSA